MRRLLHASFLGILSFVLVAPLQAAEATRTERLELSPGTTGAFVVENLAGTMRVVAGSGSKVVAVATLHAESEALLEKMQFRQVTGEKGRPTLRVEYPIGTRETVRFPHSPDGDSGGILGHFFGGTSTVKYAGHTVKVSAGEGTLLYAEVEVQLPAKDVEGTFRNLIGKITGEGVQGTLMFDSASGDISLDKVSGKIATDTGSGDVKAADVEGSFDCDTGSGNCHLTGFKGDKVSCDVGSGDIFLKSIAAKDLSTDTGSGNVRVEDADIESFDADTGSGNVLLESDGARLESIKADTGSGNVRLRLSSAASFEARADQGSGDIRVDYKDAKPILDGKIVIGYRRGDQKIRIDVSTGSGDLDIEPIR
ncbi:MAG TPA: DUF4097 family beta strand repeat-containing protein [Candidatus Polarisedimenticolia bacterium]|nr:DUF4097 family beta strand repeat-containing protein [Candidatus Polarisedimenticolia bacterium]